MHPLPQRQNQKDPQLKNKRMHAANAKPSNGVQDSGSRQCMLRAEHMLHLQQCLQCARLVLDALGDAQVSLHSSGIERFVARSSLRLSEPRDELLITGAAVLLLPSQCMSLNRLNTDDTWPMLVRAPLPYAQRRCARSCTVGAFWPVFARWAFSAMFSSFNPMLKRTPWSAADAASVLIEAE